MKKVFTPLCIAMAAGAFALSVNASAATSTDTSQPMTKQQSKFSKCAHESKGIKGDAHKKFMSACLKGEMKTADKIKAEAMKMQKSQPKPPPAK
ncbi:MAG: PsiF family protein [Gammaproteobacteria bacterium]